MRKLKSKTKDLAYLFYRLVSPVLDPLRFVQGLYGYFWFARDLLKFKRESWEAKVLSANLYPILHDKTDFTPFDAHYFYQQLWVFENVLKNRPPHHVDVGSSYEMGGYLSKIVKTTFVDLRPIKADLKNLKIVRGDALNLPFRDGSLPSLSCLHVAEHIGLGRYGDPIDPKGSIKACQELTRVLAKGGKLYFSVPIGKNRVCFNAHRIFDPCLIVEEYFLNLRLAAFSVVDDSGKFISDCNPKEFVSLDYGCGMFLFTKD